MTLETDPQKTSIENKAAQEIATQSNDVAKCQRSEFSKPSNELKLVADFYKRKSAALKKKVILKVKM